MAEKIDFDSMDNKELEKFKITFTPKKCPTCKELLVVKELGVWGYWCEKCMFWWGTYDPYPEVKHEKKK